MAEVERIYLDNAASQPLHPAAREAMNRAQGLVNPAGQYASGRKARRLLEEAREEIAELLGADPAEVIFTGSGTEADNIAIQGLAFGSRAARGAARIISADIEHPAVAESVRWLTTNDADRSSNSAFHHHVLPVDAHGRAIPEETQIPEDAALLTCMWANNETGAIQPVQALATLAQQHGVPFHTDAVQAVGHIPVDFHALGATTLAASAHKFGGPRSTGVLLAVREAKILSPIRGGGQERGLRSGTVNVAGAVGTAAALAHAVAHMQQHASIMRTRRSLVQKAAESIEGIRIWTSEPALPGHLHMSFPGAEGDSLIMLLDAAGVDASTGSACSAGVNRASAVLRAMGVDVAVARGALRFSFSENITQQQAEFVAEILPQVVAQAREAGMA